MSEHTNERTETHARDLIYRQDVIKTVTDWLMDLFMDAENVKPLTDRILELPSAQPEQRWIPCSERLPEVHESGNSFSGLFMQSKPVLVYGVPEYEENAGFHVVTYCDDLDGNTYWSTELDAVTINGVTAWMPLPEPYKGE